MYSKPCKHVFSSTNYDPLFSMRQRFDFRTDSSGAIYFNVDL